MRVSWIPALSHFDLNARILLFAGTSERTENGKMEGMVSYCLFNVQGSTFDIRHGGFQDLQWCISVSGADDHSADEV